MVGEERQQGEQRSKLGLGHLPLGAVGRAACETEVGEIVGATAIERCAVIDLHGRWGDLLASVVTGHGLGSEPIQ